MVIGGCSVRDGGITRSVSDVTEQEFFDTVVRGVRGKCSVVSGLSEVAPRAGAWIETCCFTTDQMPRHPGI